MERSAEDAEGDKNRLQEELEQARIEQRALQEEA